MQALETLEQAPPFMIAHGSNDDLFRDRLQKVSGNPVLYAELPGDEYAFDEFRSVRTEYMTHTHRSATAGVSAFQPSAGDWLGGVNG